LWVPQLDISELTDEQLAAEAAREGSDGPAFVALLERHRQRVWRICFRLLTNAEDAHDAAQEVFVRLFFHRARYSGQSKYTTWLYGIALRTCLSIRRGRQRRERRETAAREQAPVASRGGDARAAMSLDLAQMLDTLDEEDRAMLILKYAEGYAYEELAEMFELGVSACKMRVARARDKLKERFPEHQFGGETD
jgi:RNA polymerase sigma-70 factor (ECF subfamily)